MIGSDKLEKAIAEAAQDGEVAEPAALLAAARGLTHPILALQKEDQTRELVLALDQDFGFIRFSFGAQAKMSPMQPSDERRYAALQRWIIRELRAWRRTDDPRYEKLVYATAAEAFGSSFQTTSAATRTSSMTSSEWSARSRFNSARRLALKSRFGKARRSKPSNRPMLRAIGLPSSEACSNFATSAYFPARFKRRPCGRSFASALSVSSRAWRICARRLWP
jgi:hypothetical protein